MAGTEHPDPGGPRPDPTDRVPGRRPTEPTGPGEHTFRRNWFRGWVAAGLAALLAFIVLWILDADTTVLGLVGTASGLAATIAMHHLVVTGDRGERTIARPAPVDELAPLRSRRRLLGGAVGGAAVLGLGGLGALLRFGPRTPESSDWSAGARLATLEGTPVRPQDLPLGSVVTVWPEGAVGRELSAVMLIRLRQVPEPPTVLDGVVDDTLIAYSRLCSHAGCAVALYRDRDQALFCPCHQATFDARRGAQPVSGPASHPLPQLPLGIDDDGYVIATGDLTAPPGAVGGTV
ncbi:ubiquinol-cytochrome c reductase iron-sulfur subunit [Nitriliruptor alkaliphilus]|uniref:QcrA and Rieske domain-containing protein n=1 Tax=Nitriliruptor alkaliphilus TaxID=427918 RepID=UPI000698788B|nr:Rieske 2Fe-2S domain-containing protein [Nitriliruptor alkaliphilus]